jgi:hypothetical protein
MFTAICKSEIVSHVAAGATEINRSSLGLRRCGNRFAAFTPITRPNRALHIMSNEPRSNEPRSFTVGHKPLALRHVHRHQLNRAVAFSSLEWHVLGSIVLFDASAES